MSEHNHAHEHTHAHDEKEMSPQEVVSSLLYLAEVALGAADYESAATAYASVLQLEANATALYNLGSFYARGLGVARDYVEAARLFRQAELMGNERAGKLCKKCMLDYMNEDIATKSPADLYAKMAMFVLKVYPEATHQRAEAANGLVAVGLTNQSRGDVVAAKRLFRAAAEFGDDKQAQTYLDELSLA